MLHSIQHITKVYDTGDNPVLVECNDLKDYVCKHNAGQSVAKKLFAELLCHGLLDGLGVKVAPKALVAVKEEHITPSSICQPSYFKIPSFATEYLPQSVEWTQFEMINARQLLNLEDLLTIAFFDIWLGNDDRNWNNFNLLSNPVKGGWEITPIDHGACLNSLMFSETTPLALQTEYDSLIFTDHFRNLVKTKVKNRKDASAFANSLYLRIPALEKRYDEEVLTIPVTWNMPSTFINALKRQLFDENWLNETKTQFLTFIQSSLQLK